MITSPAESLKTLVFGYIRTVPKFERDDGYMNGKRVITKCIATGLVRQHC